MSNNNNSNNKNEGKRPARRSGKRKADTLAAAADDDDSSDPVVMMRQSQKELCQTLLSWLPPGATIKSADAKKLLKPFDLVRAELQHRSNVMASATIVAGGTRDLALAGVAIPLCPS